MKTKNEVAIKLTEDNRLEVFNLLKEFNQPMTWGVDNQLKGEFGLVFELLIFHEGSFYGLSKYDNLYHNGSKEIVSVDDLRQILAVECGVKELTESDYKDSTWYKSTQTGKSFFLDRSKESHFGFYPDFCDCLNWFNNFKENGFHTQGEWIEPTEQEVCDALEKECVRRYGEDWRNVKIVAHADDFKDDVNDSKFLICIDLFEIWNKNGVIYHNGVWAEPLKEDEIIAKFGSGGSDIKVVLDRPHWLIRNWSKISVVLDVFIMFAFVHSVVMSYQSVTLTGTLFNLFMALYLGWVLRINLKK